MEQDQDYGANSQEQLKQSNPNSLLSKTFGDSYQRQHIATWNSVRGVWEKNEPSLLCEHWELFSVTWPTSGMTQNGQAYELPTQVHPITDSESSSLPTPTVSDQYTANLTSTQQSEGSLHSVTLAQIVNRPDLLPTTRAQHGDNRNNKIYERDSAKPQNLENALYHVLLPTPVASEGYKAPSQQTSETKAKTGQVWLSNTAKDMEQTWGRFEPAIRRWETVLGRPAPAPTNPDGKDGNHRLSSKFTEWMMGLPEGWITDAGLTRNEELKACGNGVVPQQAELALRMLLK
jgi:hypothetical protein